LFEKEFADFQQTWQNDSSKTKQKVGMLKLRKWLWLSSVVDDFSKSENKHDRRTTPGNELFVSAQRLQEQGPETRKTAIALSPDEHDSRN
jgi:hypothetical protein